MLELSLLVLLKIAYLATGLILFVIGKNMIEKKLETKFEGEGSFNKSSFKIATTSPGLVFLVAGLIIIGVAISQEFEISEVEIKETNNYQTLVEKTRTIHFAEENDTTQLVKAELKQAKELASAGKINDAAVHLAIAVVVQPDVIAIVVPDPEYASILKQPQFNTIAHARFKLPIHNVIMPETSYSALAEEIVERVKTLAARQNLDDGQTNDAEEIARLIPNKGDGEPKSVTIGKLIELLDKSPHILLRQLLDNEKSWILEDSEILTALEVAIDRKIQNE